MKKLLHTILIFIFIPSLFINVFAQEYEINCDSAITQMDMNFCAKQGYEKAQLTMDSIYTQLENIIKERQKDYQNENQLTGKDLINSFVDSQKQWEEYRKASAGFNGAIYQGGSIQPLIYFSVMQRITEDRIKELQDLIEELTL